MAEPFVFRSKEDFYEGSPYLGGPDEPGTLTPTITSINPDTVLETDPLTTITVTGTNFIATSVIMAGAVAQPTTFVSETELTTSYDPTTPGMVNVTVNNPVAGRQPKQSNSVPFTVTDVVAPPAPTINSTNPSSLTDQYPVTTVNVNGTNFVDGAVIVVDGVDQTTTFNAVNSLSFTLDPSIPGTLQITVRNPDAQVSNSWPFTIANYPSLDSITPNTHVSGTPMDAVFIGTDLVPEMVLYVNGARQGYGTYVSPTQVNVVGWTPPGAGTYQLKLGYLSIPHTNELPYVVTAAAPVAPTITSLTPSTAVAGSGMMTVTVAGTGFTAGMTARVNGTTWASTVVSDTVLTVNNYSPAIVGDAPFDVGMAGTGPWSNVLQFTTTAAPPPAPTITDLSPDEVDYGVTTPLTITGTGFESGMAIFLGGVWIGGTVVSSTSMELTSFNSTLPGVHQVTVGVQDGVQSNSLPLTVGAAPPPAPTFTTLVPSMVTTSPTTCTATGTGFVAGSVVSWYLDTQTAPFPTFPTTYVSPTELTFVVDDSHANGQYGVWITNPDGGASTQKALPIGFESLTKPVINYLSPTVSNVSIATDPLTVNVNGSNLDAEAVVEVDGVPQVTNDIIPGSLLTVAWDHPGVAGTYQFVVRNPNDEVSDPSPFTFNAAATVSAQQVHDWSIQDVKDFVRDHPELASEVYELEKAGQARPGILNWLKTLLDEEDTTT